MLMLGSWENYTNYYCWTKGTYYFPYENTSMPLPSDDLKQENRIVYYQWVLWLCVIQATCFSLPHYFWCWAMRKARVDLKSLHDAVEAKRSPVYIARFFHRYLIAAGTL